MSTALLLSASPSWWLCSPLLTCVGKLTTLRLLSFRDRKASSYIGATMQRNKVHFVDDVRPVRAHRFTQQMSMTKDMFCKLTLKPHISESSKYHEVPKTTCPTEAASVNEAFIETPPPSNPSARRGEVPPLPRKKESSKRFEVQFVAKPSCMYEGLKYTEIIIDEHPVRVYSVPIKEEYVKYYKRSTEVPSLPLVMESLESREVPKTTHPMEAASLDEAFIETPPPSNPSARRVKAPLLPHLVSATPQVKLPLTSPKIALKIRPGIDVPGFADGFIIAAVHSL